ncbi:Uncharacterized protein TCM_002466 isoform 2 [Theobroma cacao]|uniref:Uncharacterized protein isoform 2 n=1 Tax=Theobroma cacao TaxID=3641 RepID=A0A061DUC6_THECC|nr:Uncharacterized protein TCM_002466 isoform 2 [Theobroma cacao]
MEVPVGFLAKLWSFVSFLPFFSLLFLLGLVKAAIICPVVMGIIVTGNSAVVIGLWPAHSLWTYFCVARTKRLGLVLKIVVLVSLVVPVVLWPVVAVVGSLLGGIGYGFCAPLVTTFEAVGQNAADKCYHCFADGCLSIIKGSCIVVEDFADFCFHSYFSYMDELSEKKPSDEKPMDVNCYSVEKPIYAVQRMEEAVRGFNRQRRTIPGDGVCSVCWFSNPFMAFGCCGSCSGSYHCKLLPGTLWWSCCASARPRYRRNMSNSPDMEKLENNHYNELKNRGEGSSSKKLISENSRTLKWAIQQYRPMQVWDWLFKSCEVNGRILLHDGLITIKDIEECIVKGNCRKLGIKLPALSLLRCLLASAKCDSTGLVISDGVELTRSNVPRDRVCDWFIGPLLIIKEQLNKLQLDESEETCLRKLVMGCKNEKPEDWNDFGYPSCDSVRKAQLQATIRRLQGIVASMSWIPTFHRCIRNLVKLLYIEAIQAGASANHIGGILKARYSGKISSGRGDRKDRYENNAERDRTNENEDVV